MEKIRRKTQTKRKTPLIKTLLVTMLATVALVVGGVSVAWGAAGDPPAHSKTATSNNDGTYKLELSVTGDADNDTQEAGGVNIVLVYDVSQSMTSNAGSTSYSRADQAEAIVYDFLNGLLQYQNDAEDNIRVSLVTFALRSTQTQGWTTNVQSVRNRFESNPTNGQVNFNYTGLAQQGNYGTNWDAALDSAQTLVNGVTNDDPVFVILLTDGAPTAYGNGQGSIAPTGASIGDLRTRYNYATEASYEISEACKATNGEFYGIYAYGTEADLLDDLMVFSETNEHRGGTTGNDMRYVVAATEDAPRYYNATETEQLQDAIDKIFNKVVQAMGISSVSISDGTTHAVTTNTGNIAELLEVDENSYQYWLSIPVVDNKFTRVDRDGNEIEYTVTQNSGGTCTVSWGSGASAKEVTVNGTVSSGQFKYEWTGKNDLYDYDPPEAKLVNSAVNWDLSTVGTLLDGVTYSVTFDVYPSQTTLDIVADIKNDPGPDGAWADLDPKIQDYISQNGDLKTNTTASLSWKDTRFDPAQSGSATYDNPDPVKNDAVEELAVSKDWKNLLEASWDKPDSITLGVARDNEVPYTVVLNDDNSWKDTVFISIGIMGADGQPLEGAKGHDFTFTEPTIQGEGFKWEINVPTVHPMLINNVMTMLVKVDEDHPIPDGTPTSDIYNFNGATYYVDDASVALTAVNERRSSLNITKVVDGDDAPEDAIFPFTLHVKDPLAPATAPSETEDPNHDSDYWIWISVRDKDGNRINEGVEGATSAGSGWWYAPNDTDVTIPVKAGYSIRVNNLPVGSTYSIAEGTLPEYFTFSGSELSFVQGDDEAEWAFTPGQTSTGSIDTTNAVFLATFTNTYELVDINVDKVWVDESNAYNSRPDTLTLTLNAPQGVTVPNPEIAKNGNTWTYTWKGLPKKDASGEEYEYTVSEDTVPAGYTKSPADAVEDGGTITNTYEPTAAKLELKAGKKLESPQGSNAPDVTGKYDLVLEAAKDVPMPANAAVAEDGTQTVTMKNKDGNGGMDSFGEISYTKPGVYQYKVSEEGTVKGVTNGTDSYTVTVTVADDGTGTGTLKATAKVGEKATNEVLFTNTYSVKPVKASIKVTKVLEGAELAGGAYSFTLTGDGDVNQTKTNADDGTVTFDEITYEAAGEYKYTIKEVIPDPKLDYITYDEDTANVTVNVKDNGEGELVAEVSIDKETFTNKYTATGKVDITASKEYNRDLAGGDFTFTLTGDGDVNQTKTNADDGTVTFEPIEYTLDDLKETTEVETTVSYKEVIVDDAITYVNVDDETDVLEALPEGAKLNEETRNYDVTTTEEVTTYKDEATFTYTMKEVAGDKDYITYDKHEVTVTVTVKNVGEGKLEATASYEGKTTFVNTYSASGSIELEGTKVLEGRDLAEDQFTFQLLDKDNAVLGETTNDANGKFAFSDLEALSFTEADDGETFTFYVAEVNDNKKGYTYDTEKREVNVAVTDKGDGTLSFEITGADKLEFINTFEPIPVEIDPPVVKIIKGNPPADAEFTYQMKAVEPTDAPMPEGAVDGVITITKTGAGEYEFGWITYTEPGEFMYELSELNDGKENWVYDATKYFLAVVVSEDEDGNLVESHAVVDSNQNSVDKATFTNEYTEEPINPPTGDDLAKVVTPLGIVAAASGLLVLGLGVGRRMRKDR